MKSAKAIIFDADGTLIDTEEMILGAFEHVLDAKKLINPGRDAISKLIGFSLPEVYQMITNMDDVALLCQEHKNFQLNNLSLARTFPSTLSVLTNLKKLGKKMAIVSSRSKVTLHDTLRRCGIIDYFEIIVSGEPNEKLKPHPEPLFRALQTLNVAPEETIMVGDSHVDVEAGKNAGTKTIRVTYGINTERLNDPTPDLIIDDLAQIPSIFE